MHTLIRVIVLAAAVAAAPPEPPAPPLGLVLATNTQAGIAKGLAYLAAGQRADGGWEAFEKPHPAITSLVVKCLCQDEKYGPHHPAAQRGLEFILRHAQPDGGIYIESDGLPNYQTSVALMALAAAKNPAFAERIEKAQKFLKKLQWDDGEGHEASSPWFGGQGYGKHKRPDLSNTQIMVEALRQSGLPSDDPAYQKALVFISRCQMFDPSNDQSFADGPGDGGFVYTPANGGESMAGTEMVAGRPRLRSYGSMTYAGFKSLLYANVDRDDPRIKAAIEWITRQYTLDRNPNMPDAQSAEGLYYYYYVFARALYAWRQETILDSTGGPHPWRRELCEKLLSLQRSDGSWVNEKDRWYEGNPHLVTAYSILALQTALEP